MKPQEIRELSIGDLKERIDAETASLIRMKMNHAISPLDDMSKIKKAKANIARMKTILAQMEKNK